MLIDHVIVFERSPVNTVALKLHAAFRSQLNLLIGRWHYFWQRRHKAALMRQEKYREKQTEQHFKTLDSIRRGDHWPTMKLLLRTGDWEVNRFRKELLQQLEHTVFEELTWVDVERFTGRMQRVMLLILRLRNEPDARRILQLLCDDYGEYCIMQDYQNIDTMWHDPWPSSWFSKTND